MKSSAPPLLPIFRSQMQGELLALIYLNPEAEFSLTELAAHTGVTVRAIHHEVSRLVDAGLVTDRRFATTRLIRSAGASLVNRPLTDLLAVTFGPLPVLTRVLHQLPDAEQAFIHGSWAARHQGEPGPPPGDVDVLIVGSPDPDELDSRAREAESALRREVNIHAVSRDAWERSEDPYLSTVRQRPLVEVHLTVLP